MWKIGDRVVAVKVPDSSYLSVSIGDIGTIIAKDGNQFLVQFDKKIFKNEERFTWWLYDSFEIEEPCLVSFASEFRCKKLTHKRKNNFY